MAVPAFSTPAVQKEKAFYQHTVPEYHLRDFMFELPLADKCIFQLRRWKLVPVLYLLFHVSRSSNCALCSAPFIKQNTIALL